MLIEPYVDEIFWKRGLTFIYEVINWYIHQGTHLVWVILLMQTWHMQCYQKSKLVWNYF